MKNSEPRFSGDFTPEEAEFARLLRERFGWQMDRCPSPDLLRAASEEVLPEGAAEMVAAHVRACAICSVLKQDLAALQPPAPTREQLRRVRQRIPSDSYRPFFGLLRPAPLFAIVAGVAVGLWIVRSWVSHSNSETAGTRSTAPLHSMEIAVSKAPVEIPANMLLAYRGPGDKDLPSSDEWTNALTAYQKDDYVQAASDLEQVERKYPKFADGYFYRGVSLLMLARNSEAIPNLQKAVQLAKDQRLLEARWYLGAAMARIGRNSEAGEQWQAVCDAQKAYSEAACHDLPRLKQAR